MSELKSCPFCWSDPKALMGYNYHKVGCSNENCKIYGVAFEKDQWDTRAPQNEWISVDDKLPKDAQLVLFRLKNMAKTEKGIHLYGCKTFETEYSCDYHDYDDVTHWMPLPTPPKDLK